MAAVSGQVRAYEKQVKLLDEDIQRVKVALTSELGKKRGTLDFGFVETARELLLALGNFKSALRWKDRTAKPYDQAHASQALTTIQDLVNRVVGNKMESIKRTRAEIAHFANAVPHDVPSLKDVDRYVAPFKGKMVEVTFKGEFGLFSHKKLPELEIGDTLIPCASHQNGVLVFDIDIKHFSNGRGKDFEAHPSFTQATLTFSSFVDKVEDDKDQSWFHIDDPIECRFPCVLVALPSIAGSVYLEEPGCQMLLSSMRWGTPFKFPYAPKQTIAFMSFDGSAVVGQLQTFEHPYFTLTILNQEFYFVTRELMPSTLKRIEAQILKLIEAKEAAPAAPKPDEEKDESSK